MGYILPAIFVVACAVILKLALPSTVLQMWSTQPSCCTLVTNALGGKVLHQHELAYATSLATYWSKLAQDPRPSCFIKPSSADDVSIAVSTLTKNKQCKFAIRGGGHTPWTGAANLDSGVVIDMGDLQDVTVSEDKTIAHVGAGSKWLNVYMKLDALGLAASGGRVANVGVGGLTLGGGMSFFSPRFGFACDNVENYEIVLASGKIVNANRRSYPDLFRALKGGSNNYGIVTRFDLQTFPQGKFWGGNIAYPISTAPQHIAAFEAFAGSDNYDPYAAVILSLGYSSAWNVTSVNVGSTYTKAEEYPHTLKGFTDIGKNGELEYLNTMRITNLSDFTVELAAQIELPGAYQLFATFTHGPSASLLASIYSLSETNMAPIKSAPGLRWNIVFQALPAAITKHMVAKSGNSLGLDPNAGNQVITLLTVSWTSPTSTPSITAAAQSFIDQASAHARSVNALHPYIYLNYASEWQDPIGSYGADNKAELQKVSKVYDPEGVFQRQVPGGFKLGDLRDETEERCNDI